MENDRPAGGQGDRQQVEDQIAGVKEGRLAVCYEGHTAELVRMPECDCTRTDRLRRELAPGIDLADRVVHQAVPWRQVVWFVVRSPGIRVPNVLRRNERLSGE